MLPIVYAEYKKHIVLRSDLWLIRLLAMTATTWVIAYVLSSYTLYSNSQAIFLSGYTLQIIAFILGLICFFRWLHLVMGGSCFRNFQMKISQLSMPEFSSFVFITAMILYFVSLQAWNNCQQDFRWKKRRESTLVFYVVAALFFNFAILGARNVLDIISLLFEVFSVLLLLSSRSWSHHPYVGRDEYETAELEANFRPPCVA